MDGSASPEGKNLEIKRSEEGVISLPLPDVSLLTRTQISIIQRIRSRSIGQLEEAQYPADQVDIYRNTDKLALLIAPRSMPFDTNVYDQPPYREILEQAMEETGRERDGIAELLSLAGSSYGPVTLEREVKPEKVIADVESRLKNPKEQNRLQLKAAHRMKTSVRQEAIKIIAQGLAMFQQSGLYLRKLGFIDVTPKTPGEYLMNGDPNPRYKTTRVSIDSYAYFLASRQGGRFEVPPELLPETFGQRSPFTPGSEPKRKRWMDLVWGEFIKKK